MKPSFYVTLVAALPALAQITINDFPSREFGQPKLLTTVLTSQSPNLVEGRELWAPAGIAFDYSVSASAPAVYIADTGNNRVLGWRDAGRLNQGNTADVVVGQNDLFSTFGLGPGTALSSGLSAPVAVAVDGSGNLYVMDAGNNRILRYKTPFKQTPGNIPVDLVIGQRTVASGVQPNEGQQNPSEKTLVLSQNRVAFYGAMQFDPAGNLWATDAGNHRVLRYPVGNLAPNNPEPVADVVLGQTSFTTNQPPQPATSPNGNVQRNTQALYVPSGLAFDQRGRLYVADGLSRVLQFPAGVGIAGSAATILGIPVTPGQGQPAPVYPTQYTLGNIANGTITGSPQGVFTLGNTVFVVDTPQHRVLRYDPDSWPAPTTAVPSPPAADVIGQLGFQNGKVNRALPEPDSGSLSSPITGAANTANNEIWIVDSGNNRVIGLASQGGTVYRTASRVVGQTGFNYNGANLVEGREVNFGNALAGLVVDRNSNPPHLYIADAFNNRILGFRDARSVGTDARNILNQKADLVIGQPDLLRTQINYPNGDATLPSDSGLNQPGGLALDGAGNLFVADSQNGRILRFAAPFAQPVLSGAGVAQKANLVLGQSDFVSVIPDVNQFHLATPVGVAVLQDGSIAASDPAANRILIFQKPASGDFTSGQAAVTVLGQQTFNTFQAGGSTANLNNPRHIAADSSDRLYVCDSNNGRLLIFPNSSRTTSGVSGIQVPGLSSPQGVTISPLTGESWVTNTANRQIYRFPEFQQLQNTLTSTATLALPAAPIAVALDSFDNLIVAENANRLTFYFPKMFYRHSASYAGLTVPLAPGMLALLGRFGVDFSLSSAGVQNLPWPTTLNDTQVLVNSSPAPVFVLEPGVVHFQVPMGAPDSGTADFTVLKPSTGQILAAATFPMQRFAPGIFTANQGGTGQGAITNANGSVNSAANPAARGDIVTLWLTGSGRVNNPPPDGDAPNGIFSTLLTPTVFIGGAQATVQFSGLSPQYPGLWQLNVQIPLNTPPGNASIVVQMDVYASNVIGTSDPNRDQKIAANNPLIPMIAVK